MTIIGGNLEKKEIGLPITISGTHRKTEINKVTGLLQLVEIDKDGEGKPIYEDEGTWTSDVINLGDKFQDFEKVFTTNTNTASSTFAVLTRVSDNGSTWSDWTPIAMDGTIQSETKQYIQVKIDLFAGFLADIFYIAKTDFDTNEFVEEVESKAGSYIVPTLTSNTSAGGFGFTFAETEYSAGYSAWKAFDNIDSNEGYVTKSGVASGYIGFFFTDKVRITKYKVRSVGASYLKYMLRDWVLEGSPDTTDGHNGTWVELDKRDNQVWTVAFKDYEYEISNKERYSAYRIKFTTNNNNGTVYTEVGALNFFVPPNTALRLKRDYAYDMSMDSNWFETGSLHRHKITRSEWVKIDGFNTKVVFH